MRYRCNYCAGYSNSLYSVHTDVLRQDIHGNYDKIDWECNLCSKCYSDWLDGYISTGRLKERK